MSDGIKLTLEPFEDENKQELDSAVQAAVQATEALEKAEDNVQKEVQQATLDMQNFSDEEQQMIDEFRATYQEGNFRGVFPGNL